jgi:hypothetical protein
MRWPVRIALLRAAAALQRFLESRKPTTEAVQLAAALTSQFERVA